MVDVTETLFLTLALLIRVVVTAKPNVAKKPLFNEVRILEDRFFGENQELDSEKARKQPWTNICKLAKSLSSSTTTALIMIASKW
jgi:hypothetical protein